MGENQRSYGVNAQRSPADLLQQQWKTGEAGT